MPVTSQFVAIAPERYGTPHAYGNAAGTFQLGPNLYIVCSNPGQPQTGWSATSGTPPPVLAQARVLKSIDGGLTWNEVDVDGGPQVALRKSSGKGLFSPIAACYQNSTTLIVAYFVWDYVDGSPSELRFSTFDLSSETWGSETGGGPTSSVVQNLAIAHRSSDDALVFMYDGSEVIGFSSFVRSYYALYEGAFGAQLDVDPAQAGASQDYDFAGVVSGDLGRSHFFYALPDPNGVNPTVLNQNTLTSGDALVGPVQVTDQVAVGFTGGLGPWNYGVAANRVVGGVTQLLIGYIDTTTSFLFLAKAVSANSPTFSFDQVLSTVTPNGIAGIYGAGLSSSQGAVGVTIDNRPELIATGSNDLSDWEPAVDISAIPFALPDTPVPPDVFGVAGLYIDYSSGYFATGLVVNTMLVSPE